MRNLHIIHDPRCAGYGPATRPEQPARVLRTASWLRARHPGWTWQESLPEASDATLALAHSADLIARLKIARDFDADTPHLPDIGAHARRAVSGGIAAVTAAWRDDTPAFSLMRPPGHHATASQAMGFCYLNTIALAARQAQQDLGATRVAVWDFDAHHGNGTEEILLGQPGLFFASVHQSPGYPGTGQGDRPPNVRNWPVAPGTPRAAHMAALRASLAAVRDFAPDLLLVSAGFDAYVGDPLTELTLEKEDFATLGSWLRDFRAPVAAILEGGYSSELPGLVDAFLSAWTSPAP